MRYAYVLCTGVPPYLEAYRLQAAQGQQGGSTK